MPWNLELALDGTEQQQQRTHCLYDTLLHSALVSVVAATCDIAYRLRSYLQFKIRKIPLDK